MTDPSDVVPDVGDVAYRPSPSEVARLLRARTKDSHGAEVGDWSADTRPTPEEVDDIIDQAIGDVLAQLGPLHAQPPGTPPADGEPVVIDLADLVAPAARTLVTLRAAMLVELSYFPEQVMSSRSAYEEYKRLYDDGLAALVGDGTGEGGVLPGAGGGHDTWSTPSAIVDMYGYWSWWPEPENPANWPDPFYPPVPSAVGDEPASGRPYGPVREELRVGAPWPPSRRTA